MKSFIPAAALLALAVALEATFLYTAVVPPRAVIRAQAAAELARRAAPQPARAFAVRPAPTSPRG